MLVSLLRLSYRQSFNHAAFSRNALWFSSPHRRTTLAWKFMCTLLPCGTLFRQTIFLLWNFPSFWHLMHWHSTNPLVHPQLYCCGIHFPVAEKTSYKDDWILETCFLKERATKQQHIEIGVCCVVRSCWTSVACLCVCSWPDSVAGRNSAQGTLRIRTVAGYCEGFPLLHRSCHTLKFVVLGEEKSAIYLACFLPWNICSILLKTNSSINFYSSINQLSVFHIFSIVRKHWK